MATTPPTANDSNQNFDGQVTGPWIDKENSLNRGEPKMPATLEESHDSDALNNKDELPGTALNEHGSTEDDENSKSTKKKKQPTSDRAKKWKDRLAKKAATRAPMTAEEVLAAAKEKQSGGAAEAKKSSAGEEETGAVYTKEEQEPVVNVVGKDSDNKNVAVELKEDTPAPHKELNVEVTEENVAPAEEPTPEEKVAKEENIQKTVAVEDSDPNVTAVVEEDAPTSADEPTSEVAESENVAEPAAAELDANEQAKDEAVEDENLIKEVIAVEDADTNLHVEVKKDSSAPAEESTREKITEAERLIAAEHIQAELEAQEQAAEQEAQQIAKVFQQEMLGWEEVVPVDPKEHLVQEEAAIETQEAEMEAEMTVEKAAEAVGDAKSEQEAIHEQIETDIEEDASKELDEIEQIRAEQERQAEVEPPISTAEQKEDPKKEDKPTTMKDEIAVVPPSQPESPINDETSGAITESPKKDPIETLEPSEQIKNEENEDVTEQAPSKTEAIEKDKGLKVVEETSKETPTESKQPSQAPPSGETTTEQPNKSPAAAIEESTSNDAFAAVVDEETNTSDAAVVGSDTPKLVVLIATQSFGNPTQRANQDRAMAMISSKFGNDLVSVIDGTDPSNKERRNELFGISGIRAKYPQFFVVKDGATDFVGDYEWIEAANENGKLTPKDLLGVEVPGETDGNTAQEAESIERNVSVVESPTIDAASQKSSSGYPKIILLVSKSSGSLQQRTNQDRAFSMLKGKLSSEDDLEEVDGSNPANKDRRNALFAISGIRAQYPQFFLQKSENDISFLGDFEWLEYLNETGGLTKAALLGEAEPTVVENVQNTEAAAEYAALEATVHKEKEKTPRPQLIVLISKSSGVLKQRTNQDRALGMLKGKFQAGDMEIVDGSDWANTALRNNLFEISGIRGNYPQFFLKNKEGTELTFLGDFEWIENANECGQLSKAAIFDGTQLKKNKEEPSVEIEFTIPKVTTEKDTSSKAEREPSIDLKAEPPASDKEEPLTERSIPTATDTNAPEHPSNPATTSEKETATPTPGSKPVPASASTAPATKSVKPPPVRSASGSTPAPPTEINGKRMILLISSFGGGVKQKANQFRAKNILSSGKPGSKIVPEEIDAANPFHNELIATLTSISGVTDKFPQVFLKDAVLGTYTYVGGIATLEKHHKSETVPSIFGGGESAKESVGKTANKASPNKTKTQPKPTIRSREVNVPKAKAEEVTGGDDEGALGVMHIVVAVLGVALGIGMWLSTRREIPR